MTENFNYLFQYLEKENITIDKQEFEFQIQSHPAYPSLLSIADTLSFFNIDNLATRLEKEQIDVLPTLFIAYLNEELNPPSLFLVEKSGENYLILKDKNTLSRQELEQRWLEIVLLVEKPEIEAIKIEKKNFNRLFFSILILAFGSVLYSLNAAVKDILFLLFPITGILFSVAALKDLFDAKSELLNNFCNMTASTSCATVVGSNKWKIFEIVNFSDLSMVFFGFQFMGLFFSFLTNNTDSFFTLQKILLVFAVPVIFASLYYQKYVEKKWCPLCLVIISIILLELGYLFVLQNVAFAFAVPSILLNGLVFISVLIAWLGLKKLLTNQKKLKEFQFKGSRFMRNYEVFKNTLLASNKTNYEPLSSGNLIVGNENASLKITLVTNPFCGYCKEAHTIIEEILKKHKDSVCVDFRFNFNVEDGNDQFEKVHQKLIRIYFDYGQETFLEALHQWFENKDESQLIVSEKSTITDFKINELLQEQYLMNRANEISFTPALIINQYPYPKMYDREELVYFINDLLEDEF
ncbi:protein-disulfide isomerase [Flavobacterium sp. 1]|uniref:thioredoxin domain-containing protein n=1 Tax=Flavobacterium sp. 1 TaxID=2035200 RepID=UPI000C248B40|nr:thioredoxin domain-containing protein [Flavobacterium sp. 1]PJJ10539.1 protein-disulfide isomerase [Flavobacterium sp. 1]